MANQHMMTAAANLERSLNDIQQYKNELRANLDNMKRDITERLKQIEQEIQLNRADMTQSDSDQRSANDINTIRELERQKAQLTQQLNDEQRHADEQLRMADQNYADILGFVKRLQMMA